MKYLWVVLLFCSGLYAYPLTVSNTGQPVKTWTLYTNRGRLPQYALDCAEIAYQLWGQATGIAYIYTPPWTGNPDDTLIWDRRGCWTPDDWYAGAFLFYGGTSVIAVNATNYKWPNRLPPWPHPFWQILVELFVHEIGHTLGITVDHNWAFLGEYPVADIRIWTNFNSKIRRRHKRCQKKPM